MTLTTRFRVRTPTAARPVFDKARMLVGDDGTGVFEHRTTPEQPWHRDKAYRMRAGQGFRAWLWLDYGADGPLDDTRDDDDPSAVPPAAFVEVSFDTGYGYQSGNGAGCSDLHAWMIRELGTWCDDRGLQWSWHDEYADEWHEGVGGLDGFGDADLGVPPLVRAP